MRNLSAFLLILVTFGAQAQKLHTPAEIFKIMEESSITYSVEILDEDIPPKNRKDLVNINNYYQVSKDKTIKSYPYQESDKTKELVAKAEGYFLKKNYEDAREHYLKVLEVDPSYFLMMTYVGQTYEAQGNLKEATEWYLKSIENNYIDYMAHWFLADRYFKEGKLDEALSEITIAKILNRNNPRIDISLNRIYAAKKLDHQDWTFNPQIEVSKKKNEDIKIAAQKTWLGYALTKAIWKYEPGYCESMGSEPGMFSMSEEKEGILALSVFFDKKTFKKFPELKALNLAIENKMTDAYILYEILLPDHPYAVRQLSEENIELIKEYVLLVRGELM